ncbi:hypothetical protein C0Q44_26600 [Paenibacillus sp. PCH8]|uniref:fibronectin type III domain-containing protein n=1 Tax=Paenibacillus sp. PCH8 TaxID=2066524 RepID=UPI000CF9A21B|nr:fibronectin type III domain-containing protein [Paenibacillus sp. PCH8]PQP80797.1 hypothetical protein C0Q44_26600 [Paenibacillus sp. PCH8]
MKMKNIRDKFLLVVLTLIFSFSVFNGESLAAEIQNSSNGKVNRVFVGDNSFWVLGRDGSTWSAGVNDYGQLGRSTLNKFNSLGKVSVTDIKDVIDISTSPSKTFVINSEGIFSASKSTGSAITPMKNLKAIAGTDQFEMILKEDGTVWTRGLNDEGQLGLGDKVSRSTFTQVPGLENVVEIAVAYNKSLALKSDGTVWKWGRERDRINASVPFDYKTSPVKLNIQEKIKHIYLQDTFGTAIDINDTGWIWGEASSIGSFPFPSKTGYSNLKQLALGPNHILALEQSGTVFSLGDNTYGQGARLPGLTNIKSISTNRTMSAAVSNTSQIYIWGQELDKDTATPEKITVPKLITIDDQPKVLDPSKAPSNVKLKVINDTSIKLSWDMIQNGIVETYNVYQNGVLVGQSRGSDHLIQNLFPNIEYTFYVTAVDRIGNQSIPSNSVKKKISQKYTYMYNASGQLTSIVFDTGKKIIYQYDSNGNLIKTTILNP